MIITIILFVLIALGIILYKNMSTNTFTKVAKTGDEAAVVKAFLNEMIPHHQDAVDSSIKIMNNLDITNGQVRIFAANVVDTQTFEISKMKNIYREYLGMEYAPTVSMSMHATTTADLKGDELAKKYTKDMIVHHQKAIDISKDYIEILDQISKANSSKENGLTITNSHPALDSTYELAKQIIDTQTKEIEVMKGWKF